MNTRKICEEFIFYVLKGTGTAAAEGFLKKDRRKQTQSRVVSFKLDLNLVHIRLAELKQRSDSTLEGEIDINILYIICKNLPRTWFFSKLIISLAMILLSTVSCGRFSTTAESHLLSSSNSNSLNDFGWQASSNRLTSLDGPGCGSSMLATSDPQ